MKKLVLHEEKTHCITYERDDEQYHYDLILNLLIGDLVVLVKLLYTYLIIPSQYINYTLKLIIYNS